jgi:hypothetical protein
MRLCEETRTKQQASRAQRLSPRFRWRKRGHTNGKTRARRQTKRQRAESGKRLTPLIALKERAMRNIEDLATQIHHCCSDKKRTSREKRVACSQLVKLALLSTASIFRLAGEFPEPIREIAERLALFPCSFPAHVDDPRSLEELMWNEFNLGKKNTLTLCAAPGRKTFSKKTWINKLLIDLFHLVCFNITFAELDGVKAFLKESPVLFRLLPKARNSGLMQCGNYC